MEVRLVQRVIFPPDYRLHTNLALLGIKRTVALHTVPKSIAHRERIGREGPVAVVTGKTGFVPGLATIEHAAFKQRLSTANATLGEFVLKTRGAEEFVIFWHEAAGSDLL